MCEARDVVGVVEASTSRAYSRMTIASASTLFGVSGKDPDEWEGLSTACLWLLFPKEMQWVCDRFEKIGVCCVCDQLEGAQGGRNPHDH